MKTLNKLFVAASAAGLLFTTNVFAANNSSTSTIPAMSNQYKVVALEKCLCPYGHGKSTKCCKK